jgi:hypothetical protein
VSSLFARNSPKNCPPKATPATRPQLHFAGPPIAQGRFSPLLELAHEIARSVGGRPSQVACAPLKRGMF